MRFGGYLPFSLCDFPGTVAAVAFTSGCNLCCPYCHNPDLARGRAAGPSEDEIVEHLQRRRGHLHGLVVSGGEPTLQPDLPAFLRRVRALGYRTALHTNGTRPEMLRRLIEGGLVDHVALDVKAAPERYAEVAGRAIDPGALEASVRLVTGSGVEHELRTTVVYPAAARDDVPSLTGLVRGAGRYVLQGFRPTETLDPGLAAAPPVHRGDLEPVAAGFRAEGVACAIR